MCRCARCLIPFGEWPINETATPYWGGLLDDLRSIHFLPFLVSLELAGLLLGAGALGLKDGEGEVGL